MYKAYLSIGGNLGDRNEMLKKCREYISIEIGQIIHASSIWESEAWGFTHPRNFYNQVLEINTKLNARKTLEKIAFIESEMGRIRSTQKDQAYEGRIIDIDILLFDNQIINEPDLIIPHPHMTKRNFVLLPLSEIAPKFIHPEIKKKIVDLKNECQDKGSITRLNSENPKL